MTALLLAVALLGTPHPCVRMCPAPEGVRSVELGVGTQKVLNFDGGLAEQIDDPCVDVKSIGHHQLLVIGAAEGIANVSVKRADGRVEKFRFRVRRVDPDMCGISELWKMLPCESLIRPRIVGDTVLLEGEYRDIDDFLGVREIHRRYPGLQPPPVPAAIVAPAVARANAALEGARSPVRVRHLGKGMVLVSDPPASAAQLKEAATIIAPYRELLLDLAAASP